MRIKNVALTEKGNLKPVVRTEMAKYVAGNPDIFATAEKVEGKNTYFIPVTDADGNVFYINFDVTVTTKHPADRAERKATPKAKVEAETIEIEQETLKGFDFSRSFQVRKLKNDIENRFFRVKKAYYRLGRLKKDIQFTRQGWNRGSC